MISTPITHNCLPPYSCQSPSCSLRVSLLLLWFVLLFIALLWVLFFAPLTKWESYVRFVNGNGLCHGSWNHSWEVNVIKWKAASWHLRRLSPAEEKQSVTAWNSPAPYSPSSFLILSSYKGTTGGVDDTI
jgi:hypothetical protein